jgi:hypothetical protein
MTPSFDTNHDLLIVQQEINLLLTELRRQREISENEQIVNLRDEVRRLSESSRTQQNDEIRRLQTEIEALSGRLSRALVRLSNTCLDVLVSEA